MKRTLAAIALAVALAPAAALAAKKELHLYTWADYVKPELVQRFEKEQGCRVVIDTFDSNESMYAKLKAGASGYDVITLELHGAPDAEAGDAPRPGQDAAAEPQERRPRLPEDRGRPGDALQRALHAHDDRHRLPQGEGQELPAELGGLRPGGPEGADDDAQRHARDDRRGAQVPSATASTPRSEAELAKAARTWSSAGSATSRSSRTSSTSPASAAGSSRWSTGTAATSSRFRRRTRTSSSWSRRRAPRSRATTSWCRRTRSRRPSPTRSSTSSTTRRWPRRTPTSSPTSARTSPATPSSPRNSGRTPRCSLPPDLKAKCEVIEDLEGDNAKYTKVWDEIKAAK